MWRFTSVYVHTAHFSQHTDITLKDIPNREYTLRLFVENVEMELQREDNQTWMPAKGDGRPHLQFCPCSHSEPLDLFHIFVGCSYFPISRLYSTVLFPTLVAATPGTGLHITVDPEWWFCLWWFPLLCFKRLAYFDSTKKQHLSLFHSVCQWEWIYSSFLWTLWHTCMKMANEPSYCFSFQQVQAVLELKFSAFPR